MAIDYDRAESILVAAVAAAKSADELPVEWISHARAVFALESKTYTPALATLLLAKAVDQNLDTLAIKVTEHPQSYSLRGLGHKIIVPAAVTHGFSLRATGREPLNNQPWFRYNRIDEFERVKVRKDYEYFLEVARRANKLSAEGAAAALASFLFVALEYAARVRSVTVRASGLTADGARIAAEDFMRADTSDRPQRLQAFAAACLDLGHTDVKSRRINDPSRDVPGDVQAFGGKKILLSMEVRGKPVPLTEFDAFAAACAKAGIGRALLFVDHASHNPIDVDALDSPEIKDGAVHVGVFESVAELVESALTWADLPVEDATRRFAAQMLERLREMEVTKPTLDEWVRIITVVQAR